MQHERVLVPSGDHGYREVTVSEQKVVWNRYTRSYSEYAGEDYLEEGDTVVSRPVAD
jgi:hypothetical protein